MKKSKIYRKLHRYKKRKSIYRNRFFGLGILIFVLSNVVFYSLFLSEIFQVKKINISGLEKIPTELIQLRVEQKLENHILFFKTKSIFLVNPAEIEKQLLNIFPQIAEIELSRRFPGTINIFAKERKDEARWCQQEKCFLLDKEGVIFDPIINDIPDVPSEIQSLITIIDKKEGTLFSLGEKVMEKDELNEILKIQKNLKEQIKVETKEFIVFNDRLTVKTANGWEIYFDAAGDVDWQLTKLSAVLEEKIPEERRKNLEYIELRFGNLAPFKYR